MLAQMAECAFRLGMAFAREAEQAPDTNTKIEFCRLFDRCFFALRVSTALELRLRHERQEPREAASDREDLTDRPDPPDREERDRGYDERDRDRETERASLPILLRTLDGVVADAEALPGPAPADLPTLRELLRRVKAQPPAPRPAATRPSATLRSRLAGSGAVTALTLAPPPLSPAGPRAVRRATGPPGR